MPFEHSPKSMGDLAHILSEHGVTDAVIKPLSRNHNDKNQVYSAAGFSPLYPMFDFSFSMRGASTSQKKRGATKGKAIPEAVFRKFSWVRTDGREVSARDVKMIIYAQYPETRLSGFSTVENTMPKSLSVEFTKQYPDSIRYLVLGRRGGGEAVAMMILNPSPVFQDEVGALPAASGSRVWKYLTVQTSSSKKLFALLAGIVGTSLPGCRYTSDGETVPFNGTQVCGYTLEHALGIRPNSDKYGDFEGIELKSHTQKKVTLFTPEPDMGLYFDDYPTFMTTYGYLDKSNCWRVTGIHRVGNRCTKTGLELIVKNYQRGTSLAAAADKNVHIGLFDDDGVLAAGWSLERLLNCWTAKHNNAVYVPASKSPNEDQALLAEGYKHKVSYSNTVMSCRETSAEKLFEALYNGTLFLDPAPKYSPEDPKLNKRRSQWRVNDIAKAAQDLYSDVQFIELD